MDAPLHAVPAQRAEETRVLEQPLAFEDFFEANHRADCASNGTTCQPLWTAKLADDFLSLPSFENGKVFVGTETAAGSGVGHVYAFASDCGGDPVCAPAWSADTDGEITDLGTLATGGLVYAPSREQGVLDVFDASCHHRGEPCGPLWRASDLGYPFQPVVVDGVAYVGSTSGTLSAYSVTCSTNGAECPPLWQWKAPNGSLSPPAVEGSVADAVYLVTNRAHLYSFPTGLIRSPSLGEPDPLAWSSLPDLARRVRGIDRNLCYPCDPVHACGPRGIHDLT